MCLIKNLKIKHYITLVKRKAYIQVLNYRLDRFKLLERRTMRKIFGPARTIAVWKLRSNDVET